MDVEALQKEIGDWADSQFPDRELNTLLVKMLEEVAELFADPQDAMEAADIAIIVLDYFHLAGLDMETAIKAKMEINRAREWEINKGIMRHV